MITQPVTECSSLNCTKLIKSLIQKYIKEKRLCLHFFPEVSYDTAICLLQHYFVLKLEPVLKIFVLNLKLCSQLRQYALFTSWILLQINRSLNVFLLEVHYNSLKFPAKLVSLHAKLLLIRLLLCTPIVFLYKIVLHFLYYLQLCFLSLVEVFMIYCQLIEMYL